jgi:hypothetical protein
LAALFGATRAFRAVFFPAPALVGARFGAFLRCAAPVPATREGVGRAAVRRARFRAEPVFRRPALDFGFAVVLRRGAAFAALRAAARFRGAAFFDVRAVPRRCGLRLAAMARLLRG